MMCPPPVCGALRINPMLLAKFSMKPSTPNVISTADPTAVGSEWRDLLPLSYETLTKPIESYIVYTM